MLGHFRVFSTHCATHASHLEITECRWGVLWPRVQDGYFEAVTQAHVPPLSSQVHVHVQVQVCVCV